MNLYLISQDKNCDYETYDSAIVAAPSADEAQQIHPRGDLYFKGPIRSAEAWAKPEFVKVKFIGRATKGTIKSVILSSFNAG